MKVILLGALLIIAQSGGGLAAVRYDREAESIAPHTAAIEKVLREILEDLRIRMPIGVPEMGMPILDPFKLEGDEQELELNHEEIGELAGFFKNLKVVGLQEFIVNDIDMSLAGYPFNLHLTLPRIDISASYNLTGLLGGMLPITGEGDLDIYLKNVNIYADGRLSFGQNVFTISQLEMTISFEGLTSDIRGLYGGSNEYEDFINQALSENAIAAFDYMWPELEPTVHEMVMQQGNELLKDFTVLDMLGILTGTKPIFPPLTPEPKPEN